jgi:V8-like Glu-specific endopeptidase
MKKSFLLYLKLLSTTMLVVFSFACIFAQVVIEEEGDKDQWVEEVPLDLYKPMPIPQWTHRESICPDPGSFITYDPVTKQEIIGPMSPELQQAFGLAPGSTGVDTLNMSLEPLSGRNFTSLSLVGNPEDYPWRVNCKLYMTFTDGSGNPHYYVGSCVLIDPLHCLTAGHCVYDYQHGWGWATSITVRPAYENGNSPYGYAHSTQLHSWTGWTTSGSWDHDMGVIDLDRPVGALTGWHGYGWNSNNSFFTGNTFHNPGYPAASPYNGQYMYYWYGNFDNVYTYVLRFNRQAYGGQSGSGAYWISGSNRYVYAELSHGTSTWTGDVRITSNKFGHIQTMISDDTPATFDLIPLDVNASPASIATGQTLSTFNYLVHNYSSASWSGTVNVDVYLSTNDNISTADDLIQSHSFYWSFSPKSSVRVNASGPSIPWTKPAGSYYIGVILDISDANTGNNDTDGQDAAPLTITEGSLPVPGGFYATNGTYTGYVFVDWSTVSGATHYKVLRNTVNNSTTATDLSGWITNSYWYDYTATPGTLYYYYVKAAANASGYASSAPSNYNTGWRKISPPTSLSASDGTYTGYVHTTWNYATGGNYYRVYRNTVNSSGTATAVSGWTANNSYNDIGATPGVTYYYWVKAAATSGGSRQSDFSSYNTGWRKLSPPANLQASQGVYNTYVYTSWNTTSGASHYNLYKNTVNNSNTASSVAGWTTNTNVSDYAVTPNQTYYYWVKSATSVSGYRPSSFTGYVTGHAGILDCSSPVFPYCGTAYNGNTSTGVNNVSNYGCTGWIESGPEIVHEIFVFNTGTLTATLSNLGGVNLDVFILGSCDNNDCLAHGEIIATYVVPAPGLYYIAVDGYQGSAGSYTLTIDCPPVPTNKPVQNVTILNGHYMCYDATNTITVAGSAAVPFVVQNGGNVDFKAGNKISFLVGTHIMTGGYMHAQITTTYCGWAPAPMVVNTIDNEVISKIPDKVIYLSPEIKIYPNPSKGQFNIDFINKRILAEIYVFNTQGMKVYQTICREQNRKEMDISYLPPGMYLIVIKTDNKVLREKLIIN